jgi:hypothetical protein
MSFLQVGTYLQPLFDIALIANLLKYIYRITSKRAIEAKSASTSVAERHRVIDIENEKPHVGENSGGCC